MGSLARARDPSPGLFGGGFKSRRSPHTMGPHSGEGPIVAGKVLGQMECTVKVTREGKWWVGNIDGVLGGATEATRLAGLETEVRDLLAGLLDKDDDDFELTWDMSAVAGPKE
jgi:hypothetical protein